ncbi:hypothetical protein HPB47_026468, partial [Ixodes persulcatus]
SSATAKQFVRRKLLLLVIPGILLGCLLVLLVYIAIVSAGKCAWCNHRLQTYVPQSRGVELMSDADVLRLNSRTALDGQRRTVASGRAVTAAAKIEPQASVPSRQGRAKRMRPDVPAADAMEDEMMQAAGAKAEPEEDATDLRPLVRSRIVVLSQVAENIHLDDRCSEQITFSVETRKKVAEGSILNSPSGARETSNGRWYNRWPEETTTKTRLEKITLDLEGTIRHELPDDILNSAPETKLKNRLV